MSNSGLRCFSSCGSVGDAANSRAHGSDQAIGFGFVSAAHMMGWSSAAWIVVILMALWYLVTGWNEQRKQAGVLKV
jgi:hypothetical protein